MSAGFVFKTRKTILKQKFPMSKYVALKKMFNAFCGELAHYVKSDTFSLWDHQTFELNKW